jgi:hypothetical protein
VVLLPGVSLEGFINFHGDIGEILGIVGI